MNMPLVLLCVLIWAHAASAQVPKPSLPCSSSSAEAETPSIERVIRAWYAAESANDLDAWHAQLLPNFYLFDEGIRRSGDDLFKIVGPRGQRTRQQVPDITIALEFQDLHVQVDCNAALATYTLHAVADSQKLQKHRENIYLESSWLRKEDGRWRIGFEQTTRVSEPVPSLPSAEAVPPPAIHATPGVDATLILEALRDWYAAEGAGDAARLNDWSMPDFYTFDNGKRLTGDNLIRALQKNIAEGGKAAWTITNPDISVDRDLALATFTTLRSLSQVGREQKVTSLGSALLKRADGRWRLTFLHTTTQPTSALSSQ